MTQTSGTGRAHWQDRSLSWISTAAEGRSVDDTFNQLLIERAGISGEHRVLDISSGTGDPAISIGLSLGSTGLIVATDLTPDMLRAARNRSVNVAIRTIAFAAADMAALPFPDGCFDRVTCRFGLMFAEDHVNVAAEALRVLKPQGRVAYIVWGPYDDNPPFHIFRRTVADILGREEGPPPRRHSLGSAGQLSGILKAAGYSRCEDTPLEYRRTIEDINDYIERGLKRGYQDDLDAMDRITQTRLRNELRKRLEAYRDKGVIRLPNHARIGMGWK